MNQTEEEMWNKACFLTRLVALSVKASERAGSEIKRIMAGGDLRIVEKEGGRMDIQTAADRAAQRSIVHSLFKKFGKDMCIIGEEDLDPNEEKPGALETSASTEVLELDSKLPQDLRELQPKDVVVWVDPVDGTSEFAQGAQEGLVELLEQATVLIGIGYKGRAVAGVIHQPFYGAEPTAAQRPGRTIWAIKDVVCKGISPLQLDPEKKIVVTTRSHSTKTVNDALESLANAGLQNQIVRCGGAGYKVLRMIDGGACAYLFASPGTKKWDTCAPEIILEMLGGKMTDIHGNIFRYNSNVQVKNSAGVLATAKGVDHEAYIKAIPNSVKSSLNPVLMKANSVM